jgi:KDO2-lipid IV(A) lauroyltransferase
VKINLSSFLQWKINLFLYQRLGWRFAYHQIALLHALYHFFKKEEKRQIEQAVESVFAHQKSDAEIRLVRKRVFQGIRSHYHEKLFNAFSSAGTLRNFLSKHIESHGMNAIERGLSRGKGVLLVTGHFGAVEFIPGYLAVNKYPVTALVRFSSDNLREISLEKAAKFGARIIDVDKTPNILKAILKNLRENRIVITQCDEIDEWRPSRHLSCSFLGKRINLDRTINVLIKRAHVPIVFGIMHREPDRRYELILSSWKEIAERVQASMPISVGIAALKLMEQNIYRSPEEWYQWKKYAGLTTCLPYAPTTDGSKSIRVLRPSLGKAS